MKRRSTNVMHRRLLEWVASSPSDGALIALFATTYELDPEFVDTDFLPTILGLGSWDDRSWTSRLALERSLATADAAGIVMNAGEYRGRPRTLRVDVVPFTASNGGSLHAKIAVLVWERAIRVVIGSANLTSAGYRANREVALVLDARKPDQAALIRQALTGIPIAVLDAAGAGGQLAIARALRTLPAAPTGGAAVVWSDANAPLWRSFLDRWPAGETVTRITIVSPFWSDEEPNGPLGRFVRAMQDRGGLGKGAELNLLCEVSVDADGTEHPTLPLSVAQFDASAAGLRGTARAVDPRSTSADADGRDDVSYRRPLHAKVVLVEGATTSLLYAGSANFTNRGWGFHGGANVELGVLLSATGTERAELRALIPPGTGPSIALGGAGTGQIRTPPAKGTEPPWPRFIEAVVLHAASAGDELTDIEVTASPGPAWSLSLADDPTPLLTSSDPPRRTLPMDDVNRLLATREVVARWSECPDGRRIPLRIAHAARPGLPLAPGEGRPSEDQLLAYYQGRIGLEGIWPDPEERGGTAAEREEADRAVDTSRIQSYQVRSFVDALHGISNDLRNCRHSEASIGLALRGVVSPRALARDIVRAVELGSRTPVAGGFELAELVGVLTRVAAEPDVPAALQAVWVRECNLALSEMRASLQGLADRHPELAGSTFQRYTRAAWGGVA